MGGRKSRNIGQHDLDSPSWSVTKAAKKVVHFRDNALESINGNSVIESVFSSEFRELHSRYMSIYIDRGYGDLTAAKMAANDLWMLSYDSMDTNHDVYGQMAQNRMDHLLESLDKADLFIVTPAMHATISAAVDTLETEDLRRWSGDDVISRAGLLMLPEIQPFYLSDDALIPEELIAFSWEVKSGTKLDEDGNVVPEDTLYATAWIDSNGPAESDDFNMLLELARSQGQPLPDMMPVANSALRMDFQDTPEADPDINLALRNVYLPKSEDVTPGEYSGEPVRGIPIMDWTLQYLMAFMRLSSQKVSSEAKFSRGISRDVKRKPYHDVRVVHLKSYQRSEGEPEGTSQESNRNYTRRWMVKMHKVNQWYPSTKTHKIIWRGPFIKGPENAPLISGEKVSVL